MLTITDVSCKQEYQNYDDNKIVDKIGMGLREHSNHTRTKTSMVISRAASMLLRGTIMRFRLGENLLGID